MSKKPKWGGKREGAGRKPRPSSQAVKNTTVQVEPEVIQQARANHGSLANALRFAAKNLENYNISTDLLNKF